MRYDRATLSALVRLALLTPAERRTLESVEALDAAIERAFPGAPPRAGSLDGEGPLARAALPAGSLDGEGPLVLAALPECPLSPAALPAGSLAGAAVPAGSLDGEGPLARAALPARSPAPLSALPALPHALAHATPAEVSAWFARALARRARKAGGSFFTPPAIARELAARTLAPLQKSKAPLVLDPAAGAGALLEAAREVLPRAELFAVDVDPDAVLLSRALLEPRDRVQAGRRARALWADALATAELARAFPDAALAPPLDPTVAFLRGEGRVDALIGNPPFVAAYARGAVAPGDARRELLLRRFPDVGPGEANGFLHFLELALELVRPGGRIGLVLPDTLLVNERYERARRGLLARTTDLEARVLDWPVFGQASVRAALVTATRSERRGERVSIAVFESERALEREEPASRQGATARELEERPAFAFPRGTTDLALESTLRARGRALETACWVRDGVNPGPRAFREQVLSPPGEGAPGPHVFPCLEGRDVRRYAVAEPRLWLRADPALLTAELRRRGASFREPWIFEQEKLVSRQTSPTLVFAREARGHRALNSVHATGLLPDAGVSLLSVLAVLNSAALRWYYARSSGETRRVFPQVHVAALRKLPLPRRLWEDPDAERALARLAERLEASPDDHELDAAVDALVFDLFDLAPAERRRIAGEAALPRP